MNEANSILKMKISLLLLSFLTFSSSLVLSESAEALTNESSTRRGFSRHSRHKFLRSRNRFNHFGRLGRFNHFNHFKQTRRKDKFNNSLSYYDSFFLPRVDLSHRGLSHRNFNHRRR